MDTSGTGGLAGKVAFVTGAASGIGRATALAFARADASVVWSQMKHEIPLMLKQGGGAIVNTSSGAGIVGIKGSPAYTAAKQGVIGLTRAAALD